MFCYVAGEMALLVRALADLAEEPRSVLSTHSISLGRKVVFLVLTVA